MQSSAAGNSQNKPIYLGNTDDDMFGPPGEGKKFKFRFRSRKTNKVFDINLTCVNTRVYTEFDVSGNSDSDTDVTVSVLGQTSVIPSGISDILDTLGD